MGKISSHVCINGVYQNQAKTCLKLALRPKMNFCNPESEYQIPNGYIYAIEFIIGLSHICIHIPSMACAWRRGYVSVKVYFFLPGHIQGFLGRWTVLCYMNSSVICALVLDLCDVQSVWSVIYVKANLRHIYHWAFLLTWFNFNLSMDK